MNSLSRAERAVPVAFLKPAQLLVLGFFAVILVGTLLLSLPVAWADHPLSLLDAFFMATSAVCVTGLVVVDTGTELSPVGQAIILTLIQVGGLGIATASTFLALLLGRRIGLRTRVFLQEALNQVSLGGLVRLVRFILLTTLVIEGAGALLLTLRWLPEYGFPRALYLGVFHAVSAFNNAGFDLFGGFSLTPYVTDPVVPAVVALLFISGGLGFPVLGALLARSSPQQWSVHTKVILATTGVLLLAGTLVILSLEAGNPRTLGALDGPQKLYAAFFQAATARTAGFNTVPIDALRPATLLVLAALMFVGASPGSTGGGIKTATLAVVAFSVFAMSRGLEEPTLLGRRISQRTVHRALAVLMLSGGVVALATFTLVLTEEARGFPVLALFFEAVSAFGTVGLTTGITPDLSPLGRLTVIVTMFVGRVGPLTLVAALAGASREPRVRLPEEDIMTG